ncbi:MAG: glycosyltransferase family 4 protein [Thermoplasmata archaeon]|nr:glycosyltransferase family 4 protein [Thermoplasmata archaeon]
MRIAELSTRYPPGPGGVERHVGEIARRLSAQGHAVAVLTTDLYREFPWQRLPRAVPRRELIDGVEVVRLRAVSLPGELHYPFVLGLARTLERFRPDIVHVHTYGTHQATVARRFFRRTGTPYVLTAHFHPPWSIEGGRLRHALRNYYDRRLAAPVLADARRLIVQTQAEERLIREYPFHLPPIATIPPGYAPLPAPLPGDRPFSRSLGLDGPFLLFVGRLASNKGLIPLLDAFQTLSQREPASHLVLIGEDGGMRASLEARIVTLGLSGRVHLTGFLSDEARLASAFSEARLFVLPSDYEAFGLVLLEALAQGTPVIASSVGGIPEFIEDGKAGRLVEPRNASALRAAILDLWNDEGTRVQMGEYGRREVVPRYSWDRVVDRLVDVFELALRP